MAIESTGVAATGGNNTLTDLANDINEALADERQRTHPKIGRRIMIGSVTKLAAAAAVTGRLTDVRELT